MVMKMSYILTISKSIFWLYYYSVVLQVVTLWRMGEAYTEAHDIPYKCMYLKTSNSIFLKKKLLR